MGNCRLQEKQRKERKRDFFFTFKPQVLNHQVDKELLIGHTQTTSGLREKSVQYQMNRFQSSVNKKWFDLDTFFFVFLGKRNRVSTKEKKKDRQKVRKRINRERVKENKKERRKASDEMLVSYAPSISLISDTAQERSDPNYLHPNRESVNVLNHSLPPEHSIIKPNSLSWGSSPKAFLPPLMKLWFKTH